MKKYINWEKLEDLSSRSQSPIFEKIIKLQEECGEVGSSFLGYINSPNKSSSSVTGTENERKLDLLEEVLDTMIVTIDLVSVLSDGMTSEEVQDIMDRKLMKWNSKLNISETTKRAKALSDFHS